MYRVILFVFVAGLAFSFQTKTTSHVAGRPIALYQIAQNQQQGLPENKNDQQPSEKEDSKEKETEDSDPKNYLSNRILGILSSSSGKILWALSDENLMPTPYLPEINQPPESNILA